MSIRSTQPVHSEPDPYGTGTAQTHPAFGVAVVTRSSGSSRTVFQSDLRLNETITLQIKMAERVRDLHHDRVHPRQTLVEVEVSLAQWGALVSSIGIGSGVPVTIRRTENLDRVPEPPYEPRIRASLDAVDGMVDELTERVRDKLDVVTRAFEQKEGVRAIRAALTELEAAVRTMKPNARFAVTSLAEAAEKVTAQAKADIEAHILAARKHAGLDVPIEPPELGAGPERR